MAYLIRPIKFDNEVPNLDRISKFVEEKSAQKLVVDEGEFKDRYSVALEKHPKEKLDLKKEKHTVVISGDAGTAPALFEILYTCLIHLGGSSPSNIKLLNLPITESEIEEINNNVRKELKKFGKFIWFFLFLSLLVIGFLIYLVISWLN